MGSLERRLEGLEQQRGLRGRHEPSEEERKERWLEDARHQRRFDIEHREPLTITHARGHIRALRLQGLLGRTTEELRNQLIEWFASCASSSSGAIDENAIERELARFIYRQEEGSENMVCPPQWRESLEAADRLRELWADVPAEVLARWATMQHGVEEGEALVEIEKKLAVEGAEYGISDELMWQALGPDAEQITDEERQRRLREVLAEAYYGEQGYRVQQEIDRLLKGD